MTIAIVAAATAATLAVPGGAQASGRAYAFDGPDGGRYYVYAHGGEFPTGHALEIWQESNGLAKCSIPAGLPVGHATTGEGQSGLQVAPVKCNNVNYPADTRVA